ncbi:MAG: pseudouridine synthase [Patescibacteria group bacterium]
MRIQKYLSEQKICSRREAERYITQGLVKVNGIVVTNLATQIDSAKDKIELFGQDKQEKITIAANKPRGVISEPTFLPKEYQGLNSVGRLDKESEGLLLFSNDGALTASVTSDEHTIEKEYEVKVRERVTESKLKKMASGIRLEDGMTLPAQTKSLGDSSFRILLREGRNHQIRRMCDAMHLTVVSLKRWRIGSIKLGNLKPGAYRRLSQKEVEGLKK